jgi:hypothetical protein
MSKFILALLLISLAVLRLMGYQLYLEQVAPQPLLRVELQAHLAPEAASQVKQVLRAASQAVAGPDPDQLSEDPAKHGATITLEQYNEIMKGDKQ